MTTGYFAKHSAENNAVSIARFPPSWFHGPCYKVLAPPAWLLKVKEWDDYAEQYRKYVLAPLVAQQVYDALGGHAVLLCFEVNRSRCHRGLVAEWIEQELGISVPELGAEPTLF